MFDFSFLTLSIQQRNSKKCTYIPFDRYFLSLLTTYQFIRHVLNSTLYRKVPF